jgi:hypothetical protein
MSLRLSTTMLLNVAQRKAINPAFQPPHETSFLQNVALFLHEPFKLVETAPMSLTRKHLSTLKIQVLG